MGRGLPGELQDFLMAPGIEVSSQAEMPGLNVHDLLKMLQIVKGISTRDPGTVLILQIAVWLQVTNSTGTGL